MPCEFCRFFFFNDTATTEIYTLSLHDALPISIPGVDRVTAWGLLAEIGLDMSQFPDAQHLASWAGLCPGSHESAGKRSEEHTSELQSQSNLVCRLLLEKKKKKNNITNTDVSDK